MNEQAATESSNTPSPARIDSTLAKGLSILETLAASPQGRGVTELSQMLNLNKSNTFRILRSLTALGYVKSLEDKKYAATMKAWQVGQQVMDNLNLSQLCAPNMLTLSQAFGEAIYLAVPEGLTIIYVDKLEALSRSVRLPPRAAALRFTVWVPVRQFWP